MLNRTEMGQICADAGMPTKEESVEEMQRVLDGEKAPVERPVDRIRVSLMQFILDHWRTVRAQLTCPAKSGDPRSCFQCHDMQVVACVSDQPKDAKDKIIHGQEDPR